MSISSIDDLLMGGSSAQHPMPTEEKFQDEPEPIDELEHDEPQDDYSQDDEPQDDGGEDDPYAADEPEEKPKKKAAELDEYGNEQEPARMYTEAEHKELLNKAIRERFDRFQRNNPDVTPVVSQQQVQAQSKGFEFDPDSDQSLPQQLETFIERTVTNMTSKRDNEARQIKEQEIQAEFEEKFTSGMSKFRDFRDVMVSLPFEITNPMTLATRSMENPAAFLYAAAKRNPQDLERISKMRDPYAQMTEMGKLEERMRKNKPTTKAPRPLGRTQEDATIKTKPKERDTSGDDLLAKADAKRLNTVRTRLKGHR
jgi:hypothetical protein